MKYDNSYVIYFINSNNYNFIMKEEFERLPETHFRRSAKLNAEDLLMESIPFEYMKYPRTIFVPVYPRAQVEEVIGIDSDRRTVTARFLFHITICLDLDNP